MDGMKKIYKRIAICLVLSLVVGLFPGMGKSTASTALRVRLVITDTYVTHKTYPLEKDRHRQLQVKLDNAFGTTTIRFTSKDKKIATVTKKGYIHSKKKGTVKIVVRVTCQSGGKTVSKSTWVKIRVRKTGTPETEEPVMTETPTDIYSTPGTPSPTDMPPIDHAMRATLVINGAEPAQYPMTILDTTCGRAFYNSLPRVLYLNDRDRNTKVATEENYETGYTRDDEYKPGSLVSGDFMLYGVDRYELIYKDHKTGFSYTRLGRVIDPKGLETALGSGSISVTIIKSTLPTSTPAYLPGSSPGSGGATPPVSRTQTPSPTTAATLRPGTTPTPATTVKPGTSTTPKPSGSPGTATATSRPTPYVGNAFIINAGGFDIPFIPNSNSSAATEFYNDLAAGAQDYVMSKYDTDDWYYSPLTKQYNETANLFTGEQWPAGSLVLLGNNQIAVTLKTTAIPGGTSSTILGTLDGNSKPDGTSTSGFLGTYFAGSKVNVQIRKV